MYCCGLRISEAVSLRPGQIDAGGGVIRIIGKGNKERLVPLPETLLPALREMWKTHGNRQWVFAQSKEGGHLHVRVLREVFQAACAQQGLVGLRPHSLRHAYATRLLEEGVDVRVVQMLLGHASIKSTQIYTHLTEPMREQLRPKLAELARGLSLMPAAAPLA